MVLVFHFQFFVLDSPDELKPKAMGGAYSAFQFFVLDSLYTITSTSIYMCQLSILCIGFADKANRALLSHWTI